MAAIPSEKCWWIFYKKKNSNKINIYIYISVGCQ